MSEKMEPDLDRLLTDMAALAPSPDSGGLMARILADAAREQPQASRPAGPRPATGPVTGPASRPGGDLGGFAPAGGGWIGALAEVFGGKGALAGMMLATVTGLSLGLAPPETLTSLTALSGEAPLASLDLLSGSDTLWAETAP